MIAKISLFLLSIALLIITFNISVLYGYIFLLLAIIFLIVFRKRPVLKEQISGIIFICILSVFITWGLNKYAVGLNMSNTGTPGQIVQKNKFADFILSNTSIRKDCPLDFVSPEYYKNTTLIPEKISLKQKMFGVYCNN